MGIGGVRVLLFVVDAFVALTAVGGGIALVNGLEANRFPPEMLGGTPFSSYLIPGLILAVLVGGSAAVAAAATLLGPRTGAPASMLAGAVMVGWIVGEFPILEQPSWTWIELFHFVIGLVVAAPDLALWRA